jgi:alginate O-acetyltransferase complex protein AlgI
MVRPQRGNSRSKDGPAPAFPAPPSGCTTGGRTVGPETRPPVDARPSPARLAPHRRFLPIPRPDDGPTSRPGLGPGEPETARRDLRKFLPIWGHLVLLLVVLKVYHVEGRALFLLTSIALAVLPVHYLLDYRWKRPFFLLASVVGLFAVFGIAAGLVVTALSVAFVSVCRLPIAWSARAGLVALAAIGLGFARTFLGSNSALADVAWPVLGSMLMFRMILYLYEIKHAERPEPLVDALGYFFLLPNYAFLLFPVVDYRAYKRGYFAADIHEIQASGLRMIVNGVVQLLAYRFVYQELLIPFDEVHSPATLLAFVACNYLLYLQVSGQFHVACGMLHLFGHQLPTTHHNYLLASGFTDYWRRINIYWKDFMIRVVFNPVAFRLKRKPRWVTLSVATSAVFVTTWALHGYQMFWLKGVWGFNVPDTLFWAILGSFVLVNVQLDAREKPRKPSQPNGRTIVVRAMKTIATFVSISLLWSLWSSPSLNAWFAMFRRAFGG